MSRGLPGRVSAGARGSGLACCPDGQLWAWSPGESSAGQDYDQSSQVASGQGLLTGWVPQEGAGWGRGRVYGGRGLQDEPPGKWDALGLLASCLHVLAGDPVGVKVKVPSGIRGRPRARGSEEGVDEWGHLSGVCASLAWQHRLLKKKEGVSRGLCCVFAFLMGEIGGIGLGVSWGLVRSLGRAVGGTLWACTLTWDWAQPMVGSTPERVGGLPLACPPTAVTRLFFCRKESLYK